ncbi:ABC transporter ATP-binding protein [Facklamia sp. DSM 111018]|uniref:ABC transporter ATP-binding protein n=1 Tax=Facklamia lactis TaxID=2749967 RepID=A0ABS0LPG9_9LACT|nr:ABC transporter ATP-binding protein [Facklamia lactis]MBG9980233.1 ABC transporter ATP-binding protein [Facklamia lactis]MBG9986036.1 ABC transporter ATP-binding protein [Facklamia lactis]
MSEIILENIYKTYDQKTYSVKDCNLKIHDGEFIVLVGPSGCGKSTTLRMIAGLESITEGTLSIDGQKMNHLPPKDRDLAMVFQDFALYPNLTVEKNMAYPLKMRKVDKKSQLERVKKVAETLGITDLLKRKPSQLSGGQKQRVALGRAIIREPNAFLMDEPLSNLDAKLRVQMRYEISKLHQQLKTTMIYVTHDQTEAMTMANRIVVMNHGSIQQVGSPDEIYHTPANLFVAEFMGTPKMNILTGLIKKQRVILDIGKDFELDRAYPTQKVLIGVRSENIRIVEGRTYQISLIENLGEKLLVYLEKAKEKIIVQAEYGVKISVGDRVSIEIIDFKKVSIFNPDTGQAL